MAYFPNSSAGEVFDEQCQDCPLGWGWDGKRTEPQPCPTALVQLMFNYEQVDPGQEKLRQAMTLLVDGKGECITRTLLVEIRKEAE